jgi:hypothetical protein
MTRLVGTSLTYGFAICLGLSICTFVAEQAARFIGAMP